jgi:lipopolysaccharide transport system permease protein
MLANMKELINQRELLYTWTRRDFRVRYSQSVLGVAWAILQPLALFIIFNIVFSVIVRVPTGNIPYPVFSYTALLPWTFFANAISFAIPSLVNNMDLVSKIYFSREILPLSAILVSFIDYLIASSIYIVMLIIYRVEIGLTILYFPLILLIQIILIFGISLLGSAVMVFYRDIRFVIPLALQLWMYLSPIIYPIDLVPERFRTFYYLNPMAAILESYRRIILHQQAPDWTYLGIAAFVSVAILIFSFRFFKKAEKKFADLI